MKRIIIIVLALLCAIALVACKQEPETKQIVKTTWEGDSWGTWTAQQGDTKYELTYDNDMTASLKVWTKDPMTNQWPADPILYTGTLTFNHHYDTVSETAELLERTYSQLIVLTFNTVNDPAYNSTLHTYDGAFEASYISGYTSKTSSDGTYVKSRVKGTVAKFGICTSSNEPISVLAGVSGWTCTKK